MTSVENVSTTLILIPSIAYTPFGVSLSSPASALPRFIQIAGQGSFLLKSFCLSRFIACKFGVENLSAEQVGRFESLGLVTWPGWFAGYGDVVMGSMGWNGMDGMVWLCIIPVLAMDVCPACSICFRGSGRCRSLSLLISCCPMAHFKPGDAIRWRYSVSGSESAWMP